MPNPLGACDSSVVTSTAHGALTRGRKPLCYTPRKVRQLFQLQEPPLGAVPVLTHAAGAGPALCTVISRGSSTQLRDAQVPIPAFKGRRVSPNSCLGLF